MRCFAGALTHAFTNDLRKGYGIFAENVLLAGTESSVVDITCFH